MEDVELKESGGSKLVHLNGPAKMACDRIREATREATGKPATYSDIVLRLAREGVAYADALDESARARKQDAADFVAAVRSCLIAIAAGMAASQSAGSEVGEPARLTEKDVAEAWNSLAHLDRQRFIRAAWRHVHSLTGVNPLALMENMAVAEGMFTASACQTEAKDA